MRKGRMRFLLALFFLVAVSTTNAHSQSVLGAFGDSLTADGSNRTDNYRSTDGPVWVELLADTLGIDEYWNHAYLGATTSYDTLYSDSRNGLLWQVDTYKWAMKNFNPDTTLATIWAGANDFLLDRSADGAADNISTALDLLYEAGARQFMVLNLPDIGSTPAYYYGDADEATRASAWTVAYNTLLAETIEEFNQLHSDITLYFIDVYSVLSSFTIGSDEWLSLFWDEDLFHPSSLGHELIYQTALAGIGLNPCTSGSDPVPEPISFILFGAGLSALGLVRSKRTK